MSGRRRPFRPLHPGLLARITTMRKGTVTTIQVTGNKEKTKGVTGNKNGGRKVTITGTGLVQVDHKADLRLGKPYLRR